MVGKSSSDGGLNAHVLMIPYPAQPHITPMLNLAHQLVESGGISVTLVSFQPFIDRLVAQESKNESPSDAIHLVGVPDDLPGYDPPRGFPEHPKVFRESLQLGHNLGPFVERLLQDPDSSGGSKRPTCMVVDYIHWWSVDIATKLNIPRYVLSANPASFILAILALPEHLDENKKNSDVVHVAGLPRIYYGEFPWTLRTIPFVRPFWAASLRTSNGLLLNTFLDLEREVIEALCIRLPHIAVLPVGPLGLSSAFFAKNISVEGLELSDAGWVLWLNQQPPSSVLYINFGTTGMLALTTRHVQALAKGLEAAQVRFLWVLRAPPDADDQSTELLPAGFEERMKGRGLVSRGWAPQLQILAHPSTGGYLCHCGWNSAIESLSRGIPIVAWPSVADQPIISRYFVDKAKVAVELPQQANHYVEADEIEKAVRVLMQSEEGRAMRQRAGVFKNVAAAAVAEGGSSVRNVQKFAELIRSRHPSE